MDNPSLCLAAHQVGLGFVKLDRRTAEVPCRLPPEPDDVFVAWTTLEPKNLRSSASLSRWASETARSLTSDWESAEDMDVLWASGYLPMGHLTACQYRGTTHFMAISANT